MTPCRTEASCAYAAAIFPGYDDLHGWVRILIADTGSGIPPEMIRTIFEPFVTTKGESGTGLGLWIVKGIIQNHAGKLSVKSRWGAARLSRLICQS